MAGFSLCRLSLVLVGAATILSHAARPPALRHGHTSLAAMRLHFGVPEHLSVEMPNNVHFSGFGRNPEPIQECGCGSTEEDDDVCSCKKAMKVLQCVTNGCSSGGCNCNNRTMVHACDVLASKCDNLQFSCSARKATCDSHEEIEAPATTTTTTTAQKTTAKMESDDNVTLQKEEPSYDEVYEELASLKEEKCKLQFAMQDGHKVEKKFQAVLKEIDQKMEELEKAGQKLPEMHCYKHFEEWHEPKDATKSGAHVAPVAATARVALVSAACFAVVWS